jgi:hypothetical protein
VEAQRKFAEIKLRACVKIGEISRELEKAQTIHTEWHGAEIRLPSDGKSKEQQLAEAGISTSTAQRYEELIASAAMEAYFAKCQEDEIMRAARR